MKYAQLSSRSAATLRWLICAGVAFCSLALSAQQIQTTDNPQTITGSGKKGYIAKNLGTDGTYPDFWLLRRPT